MSTRQLRRHWRKNVFKMTHLTNAAGRADPELLGYSYHLKWEAGLLLAALSGASH
jgi:hypothetical protein